MRSSCSESALGWLQSAQVQLEEWPMDALPTKISGADGVDFERLKDSTQQSIVGLIFKVTSNHFQ